MIPHSRPFLPVGEQWTEVTDRLRPGWAADGECCERFAEAAAGVMGAARGVPVSSGTAALHLALLGVGVQPGDEVVLPAYCCAALLNAVSLAGATPVLADCVAGGVNLDPEEAARKVSSRTGAIVVAHMFGSPAAVEPLLALGVPVIEDCAQSFGGWTEGRPLGARGAAVIASFYATKVITTGHGGLVGTSRADVFDIVADRVGYDNREDWLPRFNYGMSEPQAALGLWQLERLETFLARRKQIASYYRARLDWGESPGAGGIDYRFTVRVADVERIACGLRADGVDAKRPVYRPLHHYLGGDFPRAEAAHREVLSLPLGPALSDAEVERVGQVIENRKELLTEAGNL